MTKALTLALLAGLALTACASTGEEERQARGHRAEDSFRQPAPPPAAAAPPAWEKSIPARVVEPKPQQPPQVVAAAVPPPAPKPAPAPPSPPPTPISTASPYLFVSPWIGKWTYQEDPSFVMELGEDGRVAYGQLFVGTFDLLDGGKVLQLKLVGQQGLVKDRQLSPVLFTIEYAEGGNVLVLRNGGNMMVMRRK